MALEEPAKPTLNRKSVVTDASVVVDSSMSQLSYASHVRDLILDVHLATLPTKSVRAKT
jgi:hypothetical protein